MYEYQKGLSSEECIQKRQEIIQLLDEYFLRVEKEYEILVIITLVTIEQMFYNADTGKQ